ncbi:hypothetical protein MRX96_017156 [Rhipicephalus microplus]
MDRAKLPCLFLVQFLGFWCLQLSEPPGVHLAGPAAVDTLGLLFTSRLSMWKADEAAAADPEKPRAPSSTQPLHSHWPYLVTSWRYRTYLEAGNIQHGACVQPGHKARPDRRGAQWSRQHRNGPS